MASSLEGLASEVGERVPDERPVERAGKRDACLEALLVGGGARRVVAAEAHAPDGDSFVVQIGPALNPVDDRAAGALIVAADGNLVFRLTLPGPVYREHRHAAREEGFLVG